MFTNPPTRSPPNSARIRWLGRKQSTRLWQPEQAIRQNLTLLCERLTDLTHRLAGAFPTECLVCGRYCKAPGNLCPDCLTALPKPGKTCPRCGDRVLQTVDPACPACLLQPPAFDLCRGLFHYRTPVSDLIGAFKFHARLDCGLALARPLAQAFIEFYAPQCLPQRIVPVPLHPSRERKRGFNQALEISRVIAGSSGVPIASDTVTRWRHCAPQSEQTTVASRRANLGQPFRLADAASLETVQHIAVIDDVVTSMATVEALSRCLRTAGIRRIDVWCLARATR